MTPQTEQTIREVISTIPDLKDRVFLLIMMQNVPLELSDLARKILDAVKNQ